jgi:hypothetical protein
VVANDIRIKYKVQKPFCNSDITQMNLITGGNIFMPEKSIFFVMQSPCISGCGPAIWQLDISARYLLLDAQEKYIFAGTFKIFEFCQICFFVES